MTARFRTRWSGTGPARTRAQTSARKRQAGSRERRLPLNLPLNLISNRPAGARRRAIRKRDQNRAARMGRRLQRARPCRHGAFGRSEAEASRSTHARARRGDRAPPDVPRSQDGHCISRCILLGYPRVRGGGHGQDTHRCERAVPRRSSGGTAHRDEEGHGQRGPARGRRARGRAPRPAQAGLWRPARPRGRRSDARRMAAVATHLADTSALARLRHPVVAAVLAPLIDAGVVATCGVIEFELGWATRSSAEFDQLRIDRDTGYEWLAIHDEDWRRALDIQAVLWRSGRMRAVGFHDLLVAAVAERERVTLLHYDGDYDLIGRVTSQPAQWFVPRGTVPYPLPAASSTRRQRTPRGRSTDEYRRCGGKCGGTQGCPPRS